MSLGDVWHTLPPAAFHSIPEQVVTSHEHPRDPWCAIQSSSGPLMATLSLSPHNPVASAGVPALQQMSLLPG